ncbi:hypothetical protein [Pseudoalteromonas sp. 20-MNA-CIBAN-0454]|uniref:hypothetical protein n=1 Tax=Pseudoalteromonas sp. 20-MNA-CIBAN-0454 TaxID=3140424 RepID=UPI003328A6D2
MNWYDAQSVKELKEIGSFEEVVALASEELGKGISLSASNWEELLFAVHSLNTLFTKKEIGVDDDYFRSPVDKLIFSLIELDGKNRQKQLGIGPLHYKNSELAKKWKNATASKLHEDRCKHPKAKEAWHKMEEIYKEMIGK